MARYFDQFPNAPPDFGDSSNPSEGKFLTRICKVMCHELCHMLSMKHCIYFDCLMNGSNHLQESDRRSIFLCPVCLRKLHHCIRFDIHKRYKNLLEFWKGRNDEYFKWIEKKLEVCGLNESTSD